MNTILFLCLVTVGQNPDQKWTNSGWSGMHEAKPAAEAKALSVPSFPKQANRFAVDAPKVAPMKVEPPKETAPTADPAIEPVKMEAHAIGTSSKLIDDGKYVKPSIPYVNTISYDPGSRWYRTETAWKYGILQGSNVITKSNDDIVPYGEAGESLKSWHAIGGGWWAWGVVRNGSVAYLKSDTLYSATPPTNKIVREVQQQPPIQYQQPNYQFMQSQMSSPCMSGNCSRR